MKQYYKLNATKVRRALKLQLGEPFFYFIFYKMTMTNKPQAKEIPFSFPLKKSRFLKTCRKFCKCWPCKNLSSATRGWGGGVGGTQKLKDSEQLFHLQAK